MPMDRSKYCRDWEKVSREVRDAAGNCCEKCGVANGAVIYRAVDGKSWYDPLADEIFFYPSGKKWDRWQDGEEEPDWRDKPTRVVLTVAHMDAPGDVCRCEETTGKKCANPEHLRPWCQACHLIYDGPRHQSNRARTALAKKAVGSLFPEPTTA